MINTSFRLIFLLLVFSFKFSFSQLTTFTENALDRPFEYPNNTILINSPNSSADFIITIDTNNILNQILPSHFGLNFPHFIGDNVLEEENFLTHTSNLSSMYYRIPGGSGSDRYFWDGNIPSNIRYDAQISVNDLLDGTDYRIGPEEYMNIIEDLNSNAIVVVNAGYARYGIEENNVQVAAGYAADFVRYLNITLGKNIKYWEVGNELYGSWEAGHDVDGNVITGSEYGDIFNIFVDSMKAADPSIKIGAVCYPKDESYNFWTRGVLQKVENTADFLVIHDYFKRKPNPNNITYDEMLNAVIEVQQDVSNVQEMVLNYTSKDENHFPIAMTEYNSKTGEREIAMANALFITNVLAEQIKHGIQMSLLWNLENGLGQDGGDHGILARNSPEVEDHTPRPTYYAYYLMQKYFGDKMIFCYSPDTTVISYSTMFANDGLGFMLINTSGESKIVELSSNYYKSDYYWHELYSDNEIDKKVYLNGQTSDNSEGGPLNYLDIASYHRPYENDSKFELKPYSITFIANIENNSTTNYDCQDNNLMMVTTDNSGGGWGWSFGYNASWTIKDINDSTNIFSSPSIYTEDDTEENISDNGVESYDLCLIDGCYEVVTTNQFTSYDQNLIWEFGGVSNYVNINSYVAIGSTICPVFGCTDPNSFNYNPAANTDDGSCILAVNGCTDSFANNFNAEANVDDGSCNYCLNFLNSSNDIVDYSCNNSQEFENIDAIIENNPNTGSPHINLPNEICYTISPPSSGPHRSSWAKWGEYEYLPPQRWLHNLEHGGIAFLYHPCAEESVIDSLRNIACSIADDETGAFRWVLTPYPNLPSKISIVAWEWSYSKNSVDSDEIFTFILEHYRQAPEDFQFDGSYNDLYIGKCFDLIGCTEEDANNYNPNAIIDDGSCIEEHYHACEHAIEGLFVDNIIHNRVVFNWDSPEENPSHYMIRYRAVGTSSWTVMTAGPVNSNEFTGTSRTRYFMEPSTTYEWNIRARVLNEDGSTNCQSPWSASNQYTTLDACANLENLFASTEAIWVTLTADTPAAEWGVWQSKGKLRVVGTNSFRYVNGDSDGNISVLKGNFSPSTDYEWHTKAWCTGNVDSDGNSDPMYHSGWGDFSSFSTQAPCDKMPTNMSTGSGNNANTAIAMSWDTPINGQPHHYFLELTNETTGQVFSWNNLAGTSTSKTKYGQSSGDQFKWRIRGACGENGTSWATSFTGYEYFTLGGNRLGNDSQSNIQLTNIGVYPNPSTGEFNISFELENRQDVYISITNYLGKVVLKKELKDQEGHCNKTIDLGNKANGIYMLNITTNNQIVNQKIVIQ